MTKHTPGPWRFVDFMHKEGSNETLQDDLPSPAIINVIGGQKETRWGVCSLQSFNPTTEREQHLANARLIAAAPALLEALELARQDVFHHVPDPIAAKHLETIDAAIAQARGEGNA